MPMAAVPFGLSEKLCGHGGEGGSYGFADPDKKIGFGYVMNKMGMGVGGDPRAFSILKAVYDII